MFFPDIYSSSRRLLIEPLYSRGECELFLSQTGLIGNREDFQNAFMKSFDYEDNRKDKKKIYALFLEILVPRGISAHDLEEVVKNFLCYRAEDYKQLLPYCYRKIGRGNGEYVEILVGQRKVYFHEIEIPRVYQRTRYVDGKTGHFTQKDNPDALVVEAGTPMIDKKTGEQLVLKTFVSNKKNRCWNYQTSCVKEYRKELFNQFIDGIEATIKTSISKIFKRNPVPYQKTEWNLNSFSKQDHPIVRAKCIRLNRYIKKTMSELSYIRGDMVKYKAMTGYVSDINVSDMFRDYANISKWIAETLNSYVVKLHHNKKKIEVYFSPYMDCKDPNEKPYEGRNSFNRWFNRFACAVTEIEEKIHDFKETYCDFINVHESFIDFCERTGYAPLFEHKCFRYEGKRFLV